MRIARLALDDGSIAYAELTNDHDAVLFTDAPWSGGVRSRNVTWSSSQLRAPTQPSKIVCIGRNYAKHAKELGNDVPKEPLLFLKPPSSLLDPGGSITLPDPSVSEKIEHEAELGVVIGAKCTHVTREKALDFVFGYTCVGDITARDLQKKDGQWTRAKGFDTFCPVGPWIETKLDARAKEITCRVNGDVRQHGTTADMIFDVPTLIAYVSGVMTLMPGDLLVTGTPEGIGPLVNGDALEIEIASIGVLRVRVGGDSGS
jgi:2-keto-4-pentenoate hydratase/2-oxohepta-3-ene-1,7-dioic acid hydratase in catechol pathway